MTNLSSKDIVRDSLSRLQGYIESSQYKGNDPYDGLMSPLFRLPVLRSSHQIRFFSQQFIKRFPLNLRPLLGIGKGVNPVTLGLCLQGYTSLLNDNNPDLINRCRVIIDTLDSMQAKGFHGACWGYDFHWEARYARIPAFQPTVVATGIISNALYQFYCKTGDLKARELVISAAAFVKNDLHRTSDDTGEICFSYSPFDRQVVFNASLKGARLLCQAGRLTNDEELIQLSIQAVKYAVKRQGDEGSWTYAASKGKWIDNYHTGYVLDCLEVIARLTGTKELDAAMERGFEYYRTHFFEEDRIPKFYDQSVYPIDCTSAAQSIMTLLRYGEKELAVNVAVYMAQNMQNREGRFYFRKYRFHTEKTAFMRWSDAWMFAALSELQTALK